MSITFRSFIGFIYILFILIFFGFVYGDYENCIPQYFKITAYYSPVSEQSYYAQNSFKDETNLNGKGTHGAGGKKVFDGMIAAPSKYSFGTKIIIPGMGIGMVEDRGGAIVAGSGGDRIDIWAGSGVLGLRRAYGMGPISVTGYVCTGDDSMTNIGFDRPNYNDDYDDVMFRAINQSVGRKDDMVTKLQNILSKYGYLSTDYNAGEFDESTRLAVCNYQITKNIYTGYSSDCGVWGSKTRTYFKTDLFGAGVKKYVDSDTQKKTSNNINQKTDTNTTKKPTAKTMSLDNETIKNPNKTGATTAKVTPKTTTSKKTNTITDKSKILTKLPAKYKEYFASPIDAGTKSKQVKILQTILLAEGIQVKNTGIMDDQTKSAIYGLQLKYKLITPSDKSELKGYMGPSTRKLLNQIYSS